MLPRDLEFLQQQYALSTTYLCEGISSETLQQREQALQKTKDQNYAQFEQRYNLNPQTAGYLISQNLNPNDYKVFYGTALQQQLHAEICELFDTVAEQTIASKKETIAFSSDVINFADAAHDQNVKEQMPVATTLADIAWTLAGIPIGVFESVQGAVLLPYHLPGIIKGLGQAIYFVAETAALYDPEVLERGGAQTWSHGLDCAHNAIEQEPHIVG